MKCLKCTADVAVGVRFCGRCGAEVADPTSATVVFVAEDPDPLLAQVRLLLGGEYEIERECGRGGMAAVFKALDVSLRRPVALKVMLPGSAIGGEIAERLRREARRAAALDHPNIVPIYQIGEQGGLHYIVMKFIEGRPLDAIIEAQGALPVAAAVAVLRAAASALAYAHEQGTVHRDIKSSNLLVDQEGRVYVSDFGLARAAEDAKVTPSGAVVGTPQFMSPEQCAGAVVGPQGDQYSLGVVGFQMLAGVAPFDASSVLAVVQHHYFTPMPDIRGVRADIPESLVSLLERLLAKDPARRFTSTQDLAAALEALPFDVTDHRAAKELLRRVARGYRVPVVPTGALPPLPDTRHGVEERGLARRRPAVLGAGLGVLTALAAVGIWWGARPVPRHAPTPTPAAAGVAAPAAATPGTHTATHEDRRPTVKARGLVRLRTDPPDATIFIDGQQVGVGTVFDLEVPVGMRRLHIRAPGGATLDTTFRVEAGGTTRLGLIALRAAP